MAVQGFRVAARSLCDIEETAAKVRGFLARLGVAPLAGRLPGVRLLERLHYVGIRLGDQPYAVTWGAPTLPAGVEAQTKFEEQRQRFVVELDERTYVALENDHPRARFTLGHEIGHLFMH